MLTKCMKLLIVGAPGSGKGTISKRIVKDFKLHFVSSGDLLRKEISSRSEIGIACENFIKRGELVPDNMLDGIVFNELSAHSGDGWLLDGYPRKISQALTLYEKSFEPDVVVDLQVPFSEIIDRLKGRWIHQSSGRTYNMQYNKPKIDGLDDATGERLSQRDDDHPEAILARLNDYKMTTLPVLDFFRKRGKLATFHGTESDVIWPDVKKYLANYSAKNGIIHS